jgi:hypothetical protein
MAIMICEPLKKDRKPSDAYRALMAYTGEGEKTLASDGCQGL